MSAVAGLLLVGCASPPPFEHPAAGKPVRAEYSSRPRAQHAQVGHVRQLLIEIASARGWPTESLPPIEFVPNANIVDALRADAQLQMPAAVQLQQTRVFQMLGWVPDDFSMERDILAPFSQQLAGYYSFALRQIWLARHLGNSNFDATLRHELVHAVQDFRYHLATRLAWAPNSSDYVAAVHALAEGEAHCIEEQLQDRSGRGCVNGDEIEPPRSDAIVSEEHLPPVMARSLAAPYVDGRSFVRRKLREGGWPAVERAWAGELTQTRQLYRNINTRRADAIPVPREFRMVEFSPCREAFSDSFGAQGLLSALGESAPAQVTTEFVGDWVHSWDCEGGRTMLVWQLRFETPGAARAVRNAVTDALGWGGANDWQQTCASMERIAGGSALNGRDIAIVLLRAPHGQLSRVSSADCRQLGSIVDRAADFQ